MARRRRVRRYAPTAPSCCLTPALRLAKCPYQEDKTTCAKCPVHCYKPSRREQIRAVMRYAGPRMLLRHPRLAFYDLVIDGRRGSRGARCAKSEAA